MCVFARERNTFNIKCDVFYIIFVCFRDCGQDPVVVLLLSGVD